jgi:isopenicillin-N epimerase
VTNPAHIRDEFLLDPDVVFLNHGSFGACPRDVFARYQEWQLELEREPVEFLGRRIEGLLAGARAALATYVNADPDDLVFVQNATTGVNLAAWALALEPGDEVLTTNLEYGGLDLAWRHVCSHAPAEYLRMPVTVPLEDPVEEIWSGVTDRTRAIFLSHITSETALRLPVEELCSRARERGIATVIDGAHVPGHIPLDLRALDVDYYAGNCHKWLCAPKGAGFLYVRRELQDAIAPAIVSWGYKDGGTFISRHERQGTRDPAAYLTVPYAIDWLETHNWDAVRARCCDLAARTPGRVGLEPLGAPGLQMMSMRLPDGAPEDLEQRLYDDYRIEIPVSDDGTIRVSYQGYNDESDLDVLADALSELLTRAEA